MYLFYFVVVVLCSGNLFCGMVFFICIIKIIIKRHTCLAKVESQKSCRTPKQTGQMSESVSVSAGVTQSSSTLMRLFGGSSVLTSPEGLFSSLMKVRSSLCMSYKQECSLMPDILYTYTMTHLHQAKPADFQEAAEYEKPGMIVCKQRSFPHSRSAGRISHSSRRTTAS